MWRTRAVLSLLHEEIAGLPRDDEETAQEKAEKIARGRRRALIVIALDWAAILALVLFGEQASPLLTFGPTEHAVFTLAILAVAAHSGFRMGQLEKLGAVARASERLVRSDPEA